MPRKSNKQRKPRPSATENGDDNANAPAPPSSTIEEAVKTNEAELLKQLTNVMLTSPRNLPGLSGSKSSKKSKEDYKFWRTQPVPDIGEEITENEPMEPNVPVSQIRAESYSLPAEFVWCDLDLNNSKELDELFTLLNENYVEDDDHIFRFAYARDFLKWTMQPPGWRPEWHVSVRVAKNKKLVGFIAGMPCDIRVYNKTKKMVEINFLCVHKRLRDKRMAPVLIREITRRVNLHAIYQAVYTSGVVLPRPVATCRYWHRPLNPRKLVDVGFSHLTRTMTLHRAMKLYRLPDTTSLPGFRILESRDLPACRQLLATYLESRSRLHPVFSEEEFAHWFLPRDDVVHAYVVERASDGAITDMVSFYSLPSSVMQHPRYNLLRAAYSFYNVSTETPWTVLMKEALIVAKQLGYDVFNALDLLDNASFFEDLKFGIGDGNLHYYLYNWRCPVLKPEEVGPLGKPFVAVVCTLLRAIYPLGALFPSLPLLLLTLFLPNSCLCQ
ncbi:glycylpeptide N tetradecanoyltransferase [Echinococcus multilocularis]|uniref:Glycylpeptide N-tetradecanoyltransferase n=1 Tax=Echinococcus multilocularis TaxID=6211 RepID=A0A068YBS9_ECHMU|nr:glycylpeptide N tetradecanoyltransferase [Echinococcus multilocularis]